ncbi:hypothetical protein [Mesorhizobium sp. M1143]|uniref:hypothetical protein n=1 Tax=Mesorhizobium sp. M1143 TaxID=2957061 RepID=UPI00333698B0
MAKTLPRDATLKTIKLGKPLDYVIGVMKNMIVCRKLHGNARMRIGILGTGQRPNYRISYDTADGEQIFDSFWDNHVSFSVEGRATVGYEENWSTETISYDEVAALRGTIKG